MMLAYHNNPAIKAEAIAQMKMHRETDTLVKGIYWEKGRGCGVGCRYHSSDHRQAEVVDGIPYLVARLEDAIFEGLPNELAMLWPERYHSAIPVGADLSKVFYGFMYWLLTDPEMVVKYADEQGKAAITGVAVLFERVLSGGGEVSQAEWGAAARAAADAARAAAYAAADAAADAARAAAYAAYAAADAAYAAGRAARAAGRAARAAAYERMADKLIELLGQAPVVAAV